MTVSHWQTDHEPVDLAVDFLVIGAGLTGCSAALFAAAAGRSVTITDARGLGLGASSRNAGFILSGIDMYYHLACQRYGAATVRELWELSRQTQAYWHEWGAEKTRFAETGALLLAETLAEARDIEKAARAMGQAGIDCQYHERDPLGRGYHAALERRADAACQPMELLENNAVYGFAAAGREGVTVLSRRYRLQARQALICVNGYAPLLHPHFRGKIVPTRAQCLVSEPLPKPILHTCGYSDYGHWYFRETFDGRFLLGGGRAQHRTQENDTSEDRITDAVQGEIEAYRERRFPDIQAPIARRWAGIMGFSADGLPLVGRLPGLPAVGYALGFNGNGLALAAGVAERAVAMMLSGNSPGALAATRLG